ncbi:hypothetical protein Gotur_012082 [Gossypium turneri]
MILQGMSISFVELLSMIDILDKPTALNLISRVEILEWSFVVAGVIVYKRDLEEMEQIKELHSSQCCANFEDIQQHSADDGSISNCSLIKRKRNIYEEMDEGPRPKSMRNILNSIMGRLGKKH